MDNLVPNFDIEKSVLCDASGRELTPQVEEETRIELKKKLQGFERVTSKVVAKYKIEVLFTQERTIWGLNLAGLSFYESGNRLGGGGDSKVYICPGLARKVNECKAIIPSRFNAEGPIVYNGGSDNSAIASYSELGAVVCPSCKVAWKPAATFGEVGGRYSLQTWALVVHSYLNSLGGDADIIIKYAPNDLRLFTGKEKEKFHGGEYVEAGRTRHKAVYPLANFIKDVSAGADPVKRIHAFLAA